MNFLEILKGQSVNAVKEAIDVGVNVGKSALHAIAPDDIEYYLCLLKLYKLPERDLIGYLSFSVMPDNISENHTPIQNIIKTQNSILVQHNPSFAPIDISLSGTFGKKFRLLLNYRDTNIEGYDNFISFNIGKVEGVNCGIKSGYGMTKILEHILESARSQQYTELQFINYSLNTAYVVRPMNWTISQSYDSNCMWRYSMLLKAIDYIYNDSSLGRLNIIPGVAANSIGNGVTNIVNSITRTYDWYF